ncbi:hypothetical protein C1646_53433 [Rhizophagus diaphanus]|nr:hypothetical protein C1646_53433 [Rhizophagus diaphanus] [Rhizophagus sp. MUCL 43196]
MEKNFDFVYQTSFENDSFSELQKYCVDLISKEPDKIFKSPDFSSIPEKLLITIIQNDNPQTSEVQIWEHVLKWGFAQNPELPSEITNFSKDDFNTLKNTLQQCIPFIKFYNLTSKEFVDKVFPYREILPGELCAELLKTYLTLSNPDSKPTNKQKPHIINEIKLRTVDSKIITSQHAELISKWIDRLNITDKLISLYEFKLLFRASRDGHSRDKFHKICDNHSRTVTIVKVKSSYEILGGYNSTEWKSDASFGTTRDSFIFSFINDRIDSHILSRVTNANKATLNNPYVGPSFDIDLGIWNYFFGNSCTKSSYEKPIRNTTSSFDVEECEIFQIVRD